MLETDIAATIISSRDEGLPCTAACRAHAHLSIHFQWFHTQIAACCLQAELVSNISQTSNQQCHLFKQMSIG